MTLEADICVLRRDFHVEAAFAMAEGERLSIFGPSGAGKTTLLEALAGTARLARGEVRLGDVVVNAAGRRRRKLVARRHLHIAVVRQPTTLFPHLSARENVAYGGPSDLEIEPVLEAVGLAGLGGARPAGLSGGQRQRVALARAISRPFRALLLDEPFSAVDVQSRPGLSELAKSATAEHRAVALLVTHDLGEAQAFGDRLALVEEGKVIQIGDPEKVVRQPATMRAAELLGYTSSLESDADHLWALHPDRFVVGAEPERGLVLEGTVTSVRAVGVRYACELLTRSGAHFEVNVDLPPEVGKEWVVTALQPPLVARVVSSGEEG